MSNNLKNILSSLSKDIEQEKLLEYLNNELSQDEQHDVEASLNDDAFTNDAMDGLQQFEHKQDLPGIVEQLNTDLKKQLTGKTRKKRKKDIPTQPWVYYTIIFILLVCIITYVLVRKMTH